MIQRERTSSWATFSESDPSAKTVGVQHIVMGSCAGSLEDCFSSGAGDYCSSYDRAFLLYQVCIREVELAEMRKEDRPSWYSQLPISVPTADIYPLAS
jgi:hypothetical protein